MIRSLRYIALIFSLVIEQQIVTHSINVCITRRRFGSPLAELADMPKVVASMRRQLEGRRSGKEQLEELAEGRLYDIGVFARVVHFIVDADILLRLTQNTLQLFVQHGQIIRNSHKRKLLKSTKTLPSSFFLAKGILFISYFVKINFING